MDSRLTEKARTWDQGENERKREGDIEGLQLGSDLFGKFSFVPDRDAPATKQKDDEEVKKRIDRKGTSCRRSLPKNEGYCGQREP